MSSEEPVTDEFELRTTYWRGFVVPIVISLLIMAGLLVFVTVKVGEPHQLMKRVKFGALPNPVNSR
jgi:hypothetical protein